MVPIASVMSSIAKSFKLRSGDAFLLSAPFASRLKRVRPWFRIPCQFVESGGGLSSPSSCFSSSSPCFLLMPYHHGLASKPTLENGIAYPRLRYIVPIFRTTPPERSYMSNRNDSKVGQWPSNHSPAYCQIIDDQEIQIGIDNETGALAGFGVSNAPNFKGFALFVEIWARFGAKRLAIGY